jgi:hypothetical protein
VRELVQIICNIELENRVKLATRWLENNLQEPVVVGLSDEQVADLADYVEEHNNEPCQAIYDWFDEYAPKCTEQPKSLPEKNMFDWTDSEIDDYAEEIHSCNLIGFKSELRSIFRSMRMDFDKRLNQQQFQPNWDDAPHDAVEYSVFEYYTTKEGHTCSSSTLALIERPAQPAQKVEVGQVWKYMNIEFEVSKIVDYFVTCINENGLNWQGTMTDFLEKFEQVQS